MENKADTIFLSFNPNVTGNKHTIQAFCDVINDNSKTCRCPIIILNQGVPMKIAEIFKVIQFAGKKSDCSDSIITAYARLENKFLDNFRVMKVNTPPRIKINIIPYTGLIESILLEEWYEHFTQRKSV